MLVFGFFQNASVNALYEYKSATSKVLFTHVFIQWFFIIVILCIAFQVSVRCFEEAARARDAGVLNTTA